jgi:hypothetical protein
VETDGLILFKNAKFNTNDLQKEVFNQIIANRSHYAENTWAFDGTAT